VEQLQEKKKQQQPASSSLVHSSGNSTQGAQMSDATEPFRRQRLAEINAQPGSREALEAQHGQTWTTTELSEDFEVMGFMAPYVVVRRKSDGQKGSLEFQHSPRLYFNFKSDQQ
jgi:hypothetical protein